jgi:diadenosine tetraphosphatase ApaH/serine/threonine PP2A family protein phosphatase
VIADIERRSPDLVLHGGDLALMGPEPAEVVDRIRDLGWPGVVGNTDELLWRPEEKARQVERAPKLRPLLDLLFDAYAPVTSELLGEERVAWLRALPAEQRVEDLCVVHAAPGDLWRAPMADAPDFEFLVAYAGCESAEVAYGHIHTPHVRDLGSFTVANSGSVGMPWDGDPRASYLLIDEGRPEVVRVEYDAERAAALLAPKRYPDAERLGRMLREGRFVRPMPA